MQQQEELAPHVSDITRALSGKIEQDQVEAELRRYLEYGVPLGQAKRDIIRNYGGRPGGGPGGPSVAKKLRDVTGGDPSVDFVARIITVNPKEVTVQGEQRRIFYGLVGDETRTLPYTAWKDFELEAGSTIEVRNAYVSEWRGEAQINLGERAEVRMSAEALAEGELGPRPAQEKKVRELRGGLPSVSLTVRVLQIGPKEITVKGEPKTIWNGEVADDTGKVRFTAWRDFKLQEDSVVRIEHAYSRSWRGMPDLNLGDTASVQVLPSDALPPRSELQAAQPMTIGELEEVGGGADVALEGTLLEVRPGSGLIYRCPEDGCRRVLQKSECRLHGRVKGTPDLRVKAILDDGSGCLTVFLPREIVEPILGKTMDQAQEMAREAMSAEVVEEQLAIQLTGRLMKISGNATSDDFGLMLIASRAENITPEMDGLKEEAEKMLTALAEEGA